MVPLMPGDVILLNGASSSGKSTLAEALQKAFDRPFWHFSIDHLVAARVLPWERMKSGEFPWPEHREAFFEGFHRCLPALAGAGSHLIVEHIVETQVWMDRLVRLLDGIDVFFVGLHCPLDELNRRETERGNRRTGEAATDFRTVHSFGVYDLEIDSTDDLRRNVARVTEAWRRRTHPNAFERMRASLS